MTNIENLKDQIRRLELTEARCGDEYLKRVCRANINYLRKKLAKLEANHEEA